MQEVTLNNKQIRQIAESTAKIVLQHIKSEDTTASRLVGVKEAARILGISIDHMRRIKDEFPHIRRGENQQGHIYFYRDALIGIPVTTGISNNNK